MKNWNRVALVVAWAAAFWGNGTEASAQKKMLYYNSVDSLSFGERIGLRTNLASWVELTPNLGVEFTLGPRNWSKWTLGLYGRANWKTKTQDLSYNVYDVYDGRIQLRKYWHERDPKREGKRVRRSFYWGVYAGVNKFDIKFGPTGYKGSGYTAGAMIGTIQQLYGYQNGASLDLDLGLNGGVLFGKMDKYERVTDENGNQAYVTTEAANGNKLITEPLPMISSMDVLHVGLVYHFGTIVANRYKRRIDIDDAYRNLLIERKMRLDSLDRVRKKLAAIKRDSLAEVNYEKRFERQRQDIEDEYQKREQELIRQRDQFLKEEKEAEEKKKKAEEQKKVEAERKAAEAKEKEEKRLADEKAAEEKKAADNAAKAAKAAKNKTKGKK